MGDPSSDPQAAEDGGAVPGRISSTGTPAWVKAFGIVMAAVVLLIVVMLLTGHGPSRHMHGGLADHPRPSADAEGRGHP